MIDIDFDRLENELEIYIPESYRHFIEEVKAENLDLRANRIYDTTDLVMKGNLIFRESLSSSQWISDHFDFGVGDGCGNYYFMKASAKTDNEISLLCHDPEGIDIVCSADEFFSILLNEVRDGFSDPQTYSMEGNGTWDFVK